MQVYLPPLSPALLTRETTPNPFPNDYPSQQALDFEVRFDHYLGRMLENQDWSVLENPPSCDDLKVIWVYPGYIEEFRRIWKQAFEQALASVQEFPHCNYPVAEFVSDYEAVRKPAPPSQEPVPDPWATRDLQITLTIASESWDEDGVEADDQPEFLEECIATWQLKHPDFMEADAPAVDEEQSKIAELIATELGPDARCDTRFGCVWYKLVSLRCLPGTDRTWHIFVLAPGYQKHHKIEILHPTKLDELITTIQRLAEADDGR